MKKKCVTTGELQVLTETRYMLLDYEDTSTPPGDNCTEDSAEIEGLTLKCLKQTTKPITTVVVSMLPSKNTLEETKAQFVSSLSLCDPGPHAFLICVDTDVHFTERRRRQFQKHLELLGDRVWDYTIVCFISFENLLRNRNIEEYIESEGEALHWLIQKCRNRYVYYVPEPESQLRTLKMIAEVVILNGGHFQYEEGKTNNTNAGHWKMEVQQLVELKEESECAKSKDTPPQSESKYVTL